MIDLRLGDCLTVLRSLESESVHCVVTSPPYWGLRSYGTDPQVWANGHEPCAEHQWGKVDEIVTDGRTRNTLPADLSMPRGYGRVGVIDKTVSNRSTCSVCGAWRGELGLEPTPELYVEHITQIFREVKRVLRDDGTIWVNLGDSYAAGKQGRDDGGQDGGNFHGQPKHSETKPMARKAPAGLKPKDLVGIPWMVAFALRADGWYLRSDIIWAKPNPMPESVTDRPTKSHEYIFLLSKSQKYYYDADAVAEESLQPLGQARTAGRQDKQERLGRNLDSSTLGANCGQSKRNRRTVWTVATHPFKGAHFATFPPKLIEPCILAGTSVKGVCSKCGAPWERVVKATGAYKDALEQAKATRAWDGQSAEAKIAEGNDFGKRNGLRVSKQQETTGWRPTCACDAGEPVPAVVLDPFNGAGTTGVVAVTHGRNYIGIDLKPEYIEMARERIEKAQPALVTV